MLIASAAIAGGIRPWERDVSRQAGPGLPASSANDVFQREYAAAQRALSLPPGASWPARSVPPDTIIGTGRGGAAEATAVLTAWTE